MPKPLRVLVTRTAHQASALADQLRALGAEPILVPILEIAPPTSFAALDTALASLNSFDWLILTSANAVDAMVKRLDGRALPAALRIAVIGNATAAALAPLGRPADLIPPQAVAESLAEALLPHAPGQRFLLVRAETARDHLPDTLRAARAEVTIAPAYRTVVPAEAPATLRALFADSANLPDAITFTSNSSAHHLFDLLAEAGLTLPSEVRRVSIGPITSATLAARGYPAHAEAAEANILSLGKAVTSK